MNNKGTIITLIILLLIITASLIALLVLCLTGKANFLGIFNNWNKKYNTVIIDEIYETSDINNITIRSQAGDVNFEESSNDQIRIVVYGRNSEDCKITNTSGILKVDSSNNSNHNWFNFNSYISDIIVYLPSNYENEINIKINYGDCNLINLENATINIDSDCGDIKTGKVKNISVDSSYGDVNIGTVLNKCNLESSCGDIDIDNVNIKENSSIKSNLGDIKINNITDVYVDAKVDLGDIKVRNNNRHSEITLKIDNDCGDIKVGE